MNEPQGERERSEMKKVLITKIVTYELETPDCFSFSPKVGVDEAVERFLACRKPSYVKYEATEIGEVSH